MTEGYLAKQREFRKRTGNAITKRYEKTPKGFLMRVYRNMQSRVTGVQYKKAHLYLGKDLLSREEFYAWAYNNPIFTGLFNIWVQCDYSRTLTPSINRIDSSKGYILSNMEWLTHSENSKSGSRSRHKGIKE